MRSYFTFLFTILSFTFFAQTASIKGLLQDSDKAPVSYANIVLYSIADSSVVKIEVSDDIGKFLIPGIPAGNYFLVASFIGYDDARKNEIQLADNQQLDLGIFAFQAASVELAEATVKARRALVEIKSDRTVFNVQGTINSVGADAIELLRKAPSVTVDNNDNINVLGRAGVLLYVDGKRQPLAGDDLTNFLKGISADQIDRIDIITNPGAKYEAEGNAGIIDIRLKKDKSHGANGSINATHNQGKVGRSNVGFTGNYRNKRFNTYGNLGAGNRNGLNDLNFNSTQNGIRLIETNESRRSSEAINFRLGTDLFIHENHTIGFLVSGGYSDDSSPATNQIKLSNLSTPNEIDSVLIAENETDSQRDRLSYNINYRFDNRKKGQSLNIDLDYGTFGNETERFQPNRYFDLNNNLLTENISRFSTPSDIDIYTFKADYEANLFGGKLGIGTKLSQVISDNTFLVFDEVNGENIQNNFRSNTFKYDEKVYAGYVSFNRPINEKMNFSAGLRAEQTDAVGNLQAFEVNLQEPPVELNYLSWFPNVGLTYAASPQHSFALNYGRRINRPDYNVLNPFSNQLSELSFQQGNPFLSPEIVNNIELGYTHKYRYNFKLAYSKTIDQITRLIGPDESDPRANFISWANLADQTIMSFNASLPFAFTEKWNAFFNLSGSYIDNQADYGDGAVVDVQLFSYTIFQQHTFNLPNQFTAEVSGYYSGPGVWGGVFEYESSWSLNLGLQRKFLNDQLNVRLSANDIFFESGWDGVSVFDGLVSEGSGNWDSRNVSLSVSYNFGNQQVKSRKRKTGLEDEAGRVEK
ncbi:MAG: outer membrane receptor protein involved in Fe transport [Granulosicoccus sp.]|jgi:outer membrane receptor protein involved in Fe transport